MKSYLTPSTQYHHHHHRHPESTGSYAGNSVSLVGRSIIIFYISHPIPFYLLMLMLALLFDPENTFNHNITSYNINMPFARRRRRRSFRHGRHCSLF